MENFFIIILRKFDYFGVNINFYYKNKDKYKSAFGGFIFIISIIIYLIYVSLNLSNFIHRKNVTIFYFDSYLNKTDLISFENYSMRFAIGLEIQNYSYYGTLEEIYNYFDFEIKYTQLAHNEKENYKKKYIIPLHKCTHSDFHNLFNDSFDFLNINHYLCPKNLTLPITGLYSSEYYYYYEITLSAKNTSKFDFFFDFLMNTDIKLSLYYSEYAINYKNYSNPFSLHLSQIFSQVNPIEIKKKDVYFLLHQVITHKNLLFNKYYTKQYIVAYNKELDFSYYIGEERYNKHIDRQNILCKFYLRGDVRRINIERHYQKLTDFVAEITSLFSGSFFILFIIVTKINKFFLYNNLMENIFLFKYKNFTGNNKKENNLKKEIQNLLKMKRLSNFYGLEKINNIYYSNIIKLNENIEKNKQIISNSLILDLNNKNQYKNSKFKSNIYNEIDNNSNSNKKLELNIIENNNNDNDKNSKKTYSKLSEINNPINISFLKKSKFNLLNENSLLKNNNQNNISKKGLDMSNDLLNNISLININNENLNNLKRKNCNKKLNEMYSNLDKKKKKISTKLSRNFILNNYESYFLIFCRCFAYRKLKEKNKLLKYGKLKIFESLGVLTYLKLFQELKYLQCILLEDYQNILIKYISKPCISLVNEYNEKDIPKNNEAEEKFEINKFFDTYKYLLNKQIKNEIDIKLADLVDKEIEKLIS